MKTTMHNNVVVCVCVCVWGGGEGQYLLFHCRAGRQGRKVLLLQTVVELSCDCSHAKAIKCILRCQFAADQSTSRAIGACYNNNNWGQ